MIAAAIDLQGLNRLIGELLARGYEVFGPRAYDGVIGPDLVRSVDELPLGWTDEQEGGRYRLVRRHDNARFGYAVGPRSWKELLHPSRSHMWSMRRDNQGVAIRMHRPDGPRRAFLGVRPCELAAIGRLDTVLRDGDVPDPTYTANRADLFVVAVDCGDPAATCFCTSMQTGPAATSGFDLALTELVDGDEVSYVVRGASAAGADVLRAIGATEAGDDSVRAAEAVVAEAARRITRRLDAEGLRDALYDRLDSPRWEEIASRCLTCGNCTLACPTCFCTDLEDVTDLSGDHTDRWKVWDSCFSLAYSRLGPEAHRATAASRYRQWMVHKLATWIDQFGESGCVGCGRCITWCPVGIDITEEARQLREEASR